VGFIFSIAAFRYEDFFGGKKEKGSKRKDQLIEESEDSGDEDDMESYKQVSLSLSVCVCVCVIVKIFSLKIKFPYPLFLPIHAEENDCLYL
jgi:hypothetical protein